MKPSMPRLLKYPTIPAFHISKYKHPVKFTVPPAKKPIFGNILIFRGPSGAGKTTISQLLVEEHKDKVKAFHLGFERRRNHLGFSLSDKVLVLSKIKKRINLALKKGKYVILDELFDFKEQLIAVRENHPHAKIFVIFLKVPMKVSIKRASSRSKGKYYTPLKKDHIEGLWYLSHFVKCGKMVNANRNVDDVFQSVEKLLKKEGFV